jgi:hypothetical protein
MDSGSMTIRGKGEPLILIINGSMAYARIAEGLLVDYDPLLYVERALEGEKSSHTPIEANITFLEEWISMYVENALQAQMKEQVVLNGQIGLPFPDLPSETLNSGVPDIEKQ